MPLYALMPPAFKQILLLVGLAAAVAAGVALVLWSQGENYTPLYSGLARPRHRRDHGAARQRQRAVQDRRGDGRLLVPADRKYEVRMQLAAVRACRAAPASASRRCRNAARSARRRSWRTRCTCAPSRPSSRARSAAMQPVEIGARASRVAAAVGVPAAEARAERLRDAEDVLRPAPRSTSKCSRSCTSWRRACPISCRRASRSSIRPARC